MKARTPQLGDFVKYTYKQEKEMFGTYGLVIRLNPIGLPSDGQVVWFDKKPNSQNFLFWKKKVKYHVSGFLYNLKEERKDCKIVSRPPKKILKRVEEALLYIKNDHSVEGFDNLTHIEILARVKKLI